MSKRKPSTVYTGEFKEMVIEEDLITENQRLRAKNAYLKNLQAFGAPWVIQRFYLWFPQTIIGCAPALLP